MATTVVIVAWRVPGARGAAAPRARVGKKEASRPGANHRRLRRASRPIAPSNTAEAGAGIGM